jgi:hypothetical protein
MSVMYKIRRKVKKRGNIQVEIVCKQLLFLMLYRRICLMLVSVVHVEMKKSTESMYFSVRWWLVNGTKKPTSRVIWFIERKIEKTKVCFPISNWTELDEYIEQEQIEIPSIYFSHKRKVFLRDGMIWSHLHMFIKKTKNWRKNCLEQ